MLQIVCEKIESEEISYEVARQEVKEKTGLDSQPYYWNTDLQFNCDIYIYRVGNWEYVEYMESEKNGSWIHYN